MAVVAPGLAAASALLRSVLARALQRWSINVAPDGNVLGVETRHDNLYEVGGGLSWEFAPSWSINPEVLYIYDDSNILGVNYSSTEWWVTLRGDF
jgi:hypothetical protein